MNLTKIKRLFNPGSQLSQHDPSLTPKTHRSATCILSLLIVMLLCGALLGQVSPPTSAPISQSELSPAGQDESSETPKLAEKQKAPGGDIKLWQAAVLGVVEGLTEYLPVSSTGHLVLVSHYMDLSEQSEVSGPLGPKIIKNDAIDAFEVVIQIGAILAVVGLYRKQVKLMIKGIIRGNPKGRRLIGLLMTAFAPAAVLGLLFHAKIEEHLFSPYTVAGALIVGGVVMIVVEFFVWRPHRNEKHVSKMEHVQYWQALVIGFAQCLAMWPGTSRSMVTIMAGLIVGLNIVTAAEFSFLLALPTLGGATMFACAKDWDGLMSAAGWDSLLVGIIISGLAAAVAVKVFIKWLTHHGMMPFGIYRILLGLAVFAYFAKVFTF
ncbi:MAG: undecaprenyl-diphosphate phosphatase [Phycisphaerae bacterium]|nr:undecaprenyl-diphosphate phosphatase [Phycisphaerae bacterium]